jgi:hypothetical protein
MNVSGRPPLHLVACEQIDQLLHRTDQEHWLRITAMRVKNHYPLDMPVPPQMPQHLLAQIRWYASMLFKAEADQYEQFRNDGRYPAWLSLLSERVIERVKTSLERLEDGAPDSLIMGYHGLVWVEIEKELRATLKEISVQYEQGKAPSQTNAIGNRPLTESHSTTEPTVSLSSKRKQLRDTYWTAFPNVGIMDICWAAEQHYREWTRWLKGELKDNTKPDRAFSHVLTSGKDARTIRKVIRPKDWK